MITGGRSVSTLLSYKVGYVHEVYPSFKKLSDGVLEVVKRAQLSPITDEQGKPKDYVLQTFDSWGLIYKKGDITNTINITLVYGVGHIV